MLVRSVIEQLDIQYTTRMFLRAHRSGPYKKGRTRPIIAKFQVPQLQGAMQSTRCMRNVQSAVSHVSRRETSIYRGRFK